MPKIPLRASIVTAALALTLGAGIPVHPDETKDVEVDAPQLPPTGFRADYLMEFARLEERMLALAREVPEATYAARTRDDVHSIAECFIDLAAASSRVLAGMERPVPAMGENGAPEKARILTDLAAVSAAVRQAVEQTPDEGLEAPVDFLGRRWTVRALFLLVLSQTHEGLGHATAHAEDHGVDPPWVRLKRASEATDD